MLLGGSPGGRRRDPGDPRPETDRLAREAAALRGIEPAEAVRVALEGELRRHGAVGAGAARPALAERMGLVWERIEALGDRRLGRPADKALHDDLSGTEVAPVRRRCSSTPPR